MDLLAKWITLDEISISKDGHGGREMRVEFHKGPDWKEEFVSFKARVRKHRVLKTTNLIVL